MKKRITSSEIEKAKRSDMFLFILTILMLLVVIGGLIFYVLYDKHLINFGNGNNAEENIISKNETKFAVKNSNREVKRLYDAVRISNNSCGEYITSDSIKVKDLKDECKFDIASNIYNRFVKNDGDKKYVLEEDVSYAYESLFGENTYEVHETVPYLDNNYFMYSSPIYFIQGEIKESDSNVNVHEELLSIKKDNSYLYINSAVMYYESINKIICKDYDCKDIIETINDEPSSDYYNLYIKHNQKKLANYRYKFKLDKNGFYKYMGYEKTNK